GQQQQARPLRQRGQRARHHLPVRQGLAARYRIGAAVGGGRVQAGHRRVRQVVHVHRLAPPGGIGRQGEAAQPAREGGDPGQRGVATGAVDQGRPQDGGGDAAPGGGREQADRKSTRLNSSHVKISYAGFRLKKT